MILAAATLCLASCNHESTTPCDGAAATAYPPRNDDCVTIAEGVWGDVWFWDGDFGEVCASGTVTPAVREIRVYPLTTAADAAPAAGHGFYRSVSANPVATVTSDRFGFFEAAVPPGRYSLFAVIDSLLYANPDPQGDLCPVDVIAGQVTSTRLDITYRASF